MKKMVTILVLIVFIGGAIFYYRTIYKNFDGTNFLKTLSGEVVYLDRDNGILNIYKISANGKNKTLLYHNEDKTNQNPLSPRWSTDGTEIYFMAMKDGEWRTFVMDSNGDNVHLSAEQQSMVSSKSREIDIVGEKGELYYDGDGKRTKIYSFLNYDHKTNQGASEASWSPDKKYVIFQSCGMIGGCNIVIANKKGETAELTSGTDPDWK